MSEPELGVEGQTTTERKMTLEQSLELVTGDSFIAEDDDYPLGVTTFWYDEVQLGPQTNSHAKAIAEFMDDQKATKTKPGTIFLRIVADINNGDKVTEFHVDIDKEFIGDLRRLLPDPFLLIRGKLEAPEPIPVEKRFTLGDLPDFDKGDLWVGIDDYTEDFSVGNNDTVFMQLGCTVDILVGWKEPIEELRLCTQSFMQRLFEDEPGKDLTIVAGDGAEMKCHRIIFGAHSPAFAAMVSAKTGMREAQTGRVEMSENSEEGIRLLIQYMYGGRLIVNDVSSDVMVELFQIAQKYDLSQLEKFIVDLFLKKEEKWFSPGSLLELYFYVRNLEAEEMVQLRDHALSLLAFVKDLQSCEQFKKLNQAESSDLLSKVVCYLQKYVPKPWARPVVVPV